MGMPSAAAALETASSPSGCAMHCIAIGAISTGYDTFRPVPSRELLNLRRPSGVEPSLPGRLAGHHACAPNSPIKARMSGPSGRYLSNCVSLILKGWKGRRIQSLQGSLQHAKQGACDRSRWAWHASMGISPRRVRVVSTLDTSTIILGIRR